MPLQAVKTEAKPTINEAELVAELAGLHGALVERYPGFKPRLAQRRMIYEAARRLARLDARVSPLAIIEAPTGIGKSLAYLVAALAVSRLSAQRIVISTGTVLLQQQLVQRDIPAFLRACGLEKEYKVREAKGASHYLCPQLADRVLGLGTNLDLFATGPQNANECELGANERHNLKWATDRVRAGHGGGDLDTLKQVAEDVKLRIGARLSECLGSQCPDRDICPMRSARRGLFKTDIVVANHALILSLLASGGVYFAQPDECLYIFDEAHALAGVAERAFSGSLSVRSLTSLAERCERAGKLLAHALEENDQPLLEVGNSLTQAAQQMDGAFGELGAMRIPAIGALPASLDSVFASLSALEHLVGLLADAHQSLIAKGIRPDAPGMLQLSGALAVLEEGARTSTRAYELFRARREGGEVALWISEQGESGYCLHLTPLDVGRWLAQHLWRHSSGAVLTSATLRGVSQFDTFKRETGVDDGALTMSIASPFDLRASRVLYPTAQAQPRTEEHEMLCARVFLALCLRANQRNEGLLVLTASWAELRRLAAIKVEDGLVLKQGSAPKSVLLAKHRERIACAQGSVILATTSFCEGLDLPGDQCRTVLLDKIPFHVPDDPVEASRGEWIRERGANAFIVRVLPAASRRLTQAVGRLVRSGEDCGDVVILDERLATKRYGSQLLQALGPYTLSPARDGAALLEALTLE